MGSLIQKLNDYFGSSKEEKETRKMFVSSTALKSWWLTVPRNWQQLIADQLELDALGEEDVEYVSTLTILEGRRYGLDSLDPVVYLPQLTVLDISENEITDFGPLGSLSRLRELHLTGCQSIDLGVLTALPQLEILDISYPKAPHRNLEALAHLTRLRQLFCNACHLDSLATVRTLPHLEILTVPFNPLSREEVQQFSRTRPNCRVLF
ncbi:MAG: hypothetical protein D6722_17070 [Bacteroidetes bacterium]|nr:MAG: hypothetical protein D6722_17070 [Bacteroidota bacterium]